MKAPKCRLCGKHHYRSCATGHTPKEPEVKKNSRKSDPRVAQPKSMSVKDRLDVLEDRVDKLEYRKKYMRAYMAKSRKAK